MTSDAWLRCAACATHQRVSDDGHCRNCGVALTGPATSAATARPRPSRRKGDPLKDLHPTRWIGAVAIDVVGSMVAGGLLHVGGVAPQSWTGFGVLSLVGVLAGVVVGVRCPRRRLANGVGAGFLALAIALWLAGIPARGTVQQFLGYAIMPLLYATGALLVQLRASRRHPDERP